MIVPFLGQDAVGVTLRIVKLPRPHRPEERRQTDTAQNQRYWNEDRQNFHYFNRMAFSDTVIDDKDMASAAASGVASPNSASGTAMTL